MDPELMYMAVDGARQGIQYGRNYFPPSPAMGSTSMPPYGYAPRRYMPRIHPPMRVYRRTANFVRTRSRYRPTKRFRRRRFGRTKKKTFKRRRRFKRKTKGIFNVLGGVKVIENGGQITDPNAVYLGHGTAMNQVLESFARALIRKLFKKAGIEIDSWHDHVKMPTAQIVFQYYTNELGTAIQSNGYNLSDVSYEAHVAAYADQLTTIIFGVGASNYKTLVPYSWSLNGANTDSDTSSYSRIYADGLTFHFFNTSKLRIQNVTLGTIHDIEDVEVAFNAAQLDRNPLLGKHYRTKKWHNGFTPKTRNVHNTEAGYDGFIAHTQTGVIKAEAANNVSTELKKPQPGWFFNARSKNVTLEPSEIKQSKFIFKCKIGVKRFFEKLHLAWIDQSAIKLMPFGSAAMYGLEKMLDSRLSEASVVIQFEINQRYCGYVSEGKHRTTTIMEVGASIQ